MTSRSLIACAFAATLVACEMPESRYKALLTSADSALGVEQKQLEQRFHIGSYRRYDYDEAAGIIVFSDSGTARVLADVQFVGDVARHDSTWKWAWELPYVAPRLARAASEARRYGWIHGVPRLRESGWHADQVDGWEMTSLAAWLTTAEGAYRAPSSDSTTYTFMLLHHVRWAPPGRRVDSYIVSPRRSSSSEGRVQLLEPKL